jgi:CheY-like chemotaxis protein
LAETTAGTPFGVICFTEPAGAGAAQAADALRGHLREGDAVIVWEGQLVAAVAGDGSGVRAVLDRLAADTHLAAAGLTLVQGSEGHGSTGGGVVDMVERGGIDLRSRQEFEQSGVRVLVVDDEHPIRQLLRTLLAAEGWSVVDAPSAEAALADFASQRPDVVVTDNQMPGMSGIELAETLRRCAGDLPIVLFTAALTPDVAEAADALGVRVVAKAVPTALIDEVRSIVQLR